MCKRQHGSGTSSLVAVAFDCGQQNSSYILLVAVRDSIKINSRSKTYIFSSTYLKDYHASDIFLMVCAQCAVCSTATASCSIHNRCKITSQPKQTQLSAFQHLKKTSLMSHHRCDVGRMTRGWHSSNSSKMVVNCIFVYEAVWISIAPISHSQPRDV